MLVQLKEPTKHNSISNNIVHNNGALTEEYHAVSKAINNTKVDKMINGKLRLC